MVCRLNTIEHGVDQDKSAWRFVEPGGLVGGWVNRRGRERSIWCLCVSWPDWSKRCKRPLLCSIYEVALASELSDLHRMQKVVSKFRQGDDSAEGVIHSGWSGDMHRSSISECLVQFLQPNNHQCLPTPVAFRSSKMHYYPSD